jgi:hypothetical protein
MKRVSSVTVLLDASPSGHTSIEISGAASRRVVDAIRYRVAADLELEEVS